PVTYFHPLLEKSLEKTLGVPLFQEQLMQMAIDVAGFTPAESDQLRQAMGSKRSHERMARLRERLMAGMAERGITGETAEAIHEKDGSVRLGLEYVRNVGDDLAKRIADHQPYDSAEDLVRRTGATQPAVEALATAGAFASLGSADEPLGRREALWGAGAASQTRPDRLAGVVTGTDAPQLPGMADVEVAAADLWATGISFRHPMEFVRRRLDAAGAVSIAGLEHVDDRARVLGGGVVTHRQRPSTAQG